MEQEGPEKINKLTALSGILTFAALVLFFLLMKLFKLHNIIELHYFNLVLVTAGMYYTLSAAKKISGKLRYLYALMLAFKTAYIAAGLFSVFIALYLYVIDPAFMETIKLNAPLGFYMTPWIIAGVLFGEAIGSAVIAALILLNFFTADAETE